MQRSGPVRIEALLAHREWAKGLARALVQDPADAEDLEQQAWVEALRSPPARDEGLRGWFATILRRRARDLWRTGERRGRREAEAARPEPARATADVVAEAEAHRLVVEALMALEEPYRETLLLRFFEDLPPRAVADRQGVPAETVRTRTRRGLERLRERLDGRAPGGRAAWMAMVVPLAGVRWEPGAAAAAAATGGAVMATNATVTVGVLGALAGSVVGGVAAGSLSGGAPPAALEEARAEVQEIRGRLEAVEASPGPAASRLETQERRIRELEATVAVLRERPASTAAPNAPVAPAAREKAVREAAAAKDAAEADRARAEAERKMGRDDAKQAFLDRRKSDEERAVAFGRLRSLRAMDREVLAEAMQMFRTSGKAGVREWLLRDLHGEKDPEVKALFLEALRSDDDEKVRERAARDIDTYLDDPAVRQALETARDGDASEAVRRRAVRTLASGAPKDDDD